MFKRHPLIIIFLSGFILLLSGIGTSYYWLTQIYLPEQINANEEAKKLYEWTEFDSFSPPQDRVITKAQLDKFLLVNESLYFFLQQLSSNYSDSQWQVVFEMVKLRPEWQAKKYFALKKFGLSPREYDFIADEITKYWIMRLKEKSINHLNEMGWKIFENKFDTVTHSTSYELFSSEEEKLNNIFTLFLDQDVRNMFLQFNADSVNSDSLP